jgi:catechol 2,3-dioxygenase-like lactoylglutathione lyase family enzyme
MLDHIGLAVADMDRSKAFYEAALKPLGLGVVMEVTAAQTGSEAHAGFGESGKPFFWIGSGPNPKGGTHVAFAAETREQVGAFYAELPSSLRRMSLIWRNKCRRGGGSTGYRRRRGERRPSSGWVLVG